MPKLEDCQVIKDIQKSLDESSGGINEIEVKAIAQQCFDNNETIHPEQEICTGPFERCSSRTGWWSGFQDIGGTNWSQGYSNVGNIARVEGDWVPVGSAVISPDCICDMTFVSDTGNHYILSRRNRSYYWLDYRLVVNGAAVLTRTYDKYWYLDETTDNNPEVIENIQYNLQDMGVFVDHRLAIPAGATVQVEAKQRYQTAAAQSSDYFRVIGGLRSQTVYSFSPRQIVTGRV